MSDFILCQFCQKPIRNGNEIMRCIEGKILDKIDINEIHITSELWFHLDCFYKWKKK